MCGELEDEKGFDEELVSRLLYIARGYGVANVAPRDQAPLTGDSERPAYMSALFRRSLGEAISDVLAVAEGGQAETIANQAVVFARLAGFLAGQLPPGAEMARSTMEALLDGYAEPARMFEHLRDHDHGHDHDHDHSHHH